MSGMTTEQDNKAGKKQRAQGKALQECALDDATLEFAAAGFAAVLPFQRDPIDCDRHRD